MYYTSWALAKKYAAFFDPVIEVRQDRNFFTRLIQILTSVQKEKTFIFATLVFLCLKLFYSFSVFAIFFVS